MPSINITNIYSTTDGNAYPWTYNSTNTFTSTQAVIYINAIINNILTVNGSASGWTVQYTANQTIITMDSYALPDGTTGNAPTASYNIEYAASGNTIDTTVYIKFTFTYNPALVTPGCNSTYVYTTSSVPVSF